MRLQGNAADPSSEVVDMQHPPSSSSLTSSSGVVGSLSGELSGEVRALLAGLNMNIHNSCWSCASGDRARNSSRQRANKSTLLANFMKHCPVAQCRQPLPLRLSLLSALRMETLNWSMPLGLPCRGDTLSATPLRAERAAMNPHAARCGCKARWKHQDPWPKFPHQNVVASHSGCPSDLAIHVVAAREHALNTLFLHARPLATVSSAGSETHYGHAGPLI